VYKKAGVINIIQFSSGKELWSRVRMSRRMLESIDTNAVSETVITVTKTTRNKVAVDWSTSLNSTHTN